MFSPLFTASGIKKKIKEKRKKERNIKREREIGLEIITSFSLILKTDDFMFVCICLQYWV